MPKTPPTQKPVILSAAQRSRKICGCFSSLFDKPINRTQPHLVSGRAPSRAENAPHPKTCHLERSAAKSKDLRLLFVLFSEPTNRPHLGLASAHDFSRAENHPPPKTCHLERSAAESKDLRLLFVLFSEPTNRTQPHLVPGHDLSRADNATSSDADLSPCVPTLGNFRLAGHSPEGAVTPRGFGEL